MAQPRRVDAADDTGMPYCDRAVEPSETVRRLQPHFGALGITRVARQTGLDRIGIPCFAAFRPNATTLANSQGKGIDDDAARASAVMEAAEFAIAERPRLPVVVATPGELRSSGQGVFDAHRLMPMGQGIPVDEALPFVSGFDLLSAAEVLVPYDAATITIDPVRLRGLTRSTNGLASGNTGDEAVLHGLCELIERDATTLASLGSTAAPLIAPAAFEDREVDRLVGLIDNAGCELWLEDQTTDLGVPSFRAVIGDPVQGYQRHFDLAVGYGSHPSSVRAVIRAITEAAQTRVTNAAGSRDDFMPGEYAKAANATVLESLRARPVDRIYVRGCPLGTPSQELMAFIMDRLRDGHVDDLTVVPLGGEALGISVVKVFAPQLEDRFSNRNWRPGKRALKILLEAA